MPQYGLFSSLFRTFYSKNFYQDVLFRWTGSGFLNLFLVLAICWLPLLFVTYDTDTVIAMIKKGPESFHQITQGFDANYQIESVVSQEGKRLTVTEIKTLKNNDKATRTKVVEVREPGETSVTRVTETTTTQSAQPTHHATQKEVLPLEKPTYSIGLNLVLYFFALIGSMMYRVVQVLLYSLFAYIFSSVMRKKVEYGTLLRLAAVAVVPSIVLSTVINLFSIAFPKGVLLLVYFMMTLFYIGFGLLTNRERLPSNATSESS